MNVFSSIKNSFVITYKNLILAQPFVLFLLVFSILSGGLYSVQKNPIAFIVFGLSLILLMTAFLAGWFYMAKKTIAFELYEDLEEEEKSLKSFGLIKHFFPGVGEYFLPMVGLFVIFMLLSSAAAFLIYKLGIKYIGAPDFDAAAFKAAAVSAAKMQEYLASVPVAKLKNFVYWVTFVSFSGMIFQFLTMWFVPAMFYNSKNPLKALFLGIKFLFKHFFASVVIACFLVMFNVVVSMVNSLFAFNVILSLIGFLLFFYYGTYFIVLIFLYYGQNGEHSAKDYINSGADCDGEKLAGGETGEKD